MNAKATKLRELLQRQAMLVVPGCYDCITGMAIGRSSFEAAYMSGGMTAAAHGFPDYGLITMTEMVENAGRIAASIDLPLISDADTGYGNVLNVTRTVREFDMRGVAAIHIEDQEFPKRCGHLDGKRLIPAEEYAQKIRAAVAAKASSDFIVIARIDAISVEGFEAAISRGNAALSAGADVVFVEAPQSLEQAAEVPRRIGGPTLLNIVMNGKTPNLSTHDAQAMGYDIAIVPGLLSRAVQLSCAESLEELAQTGSYPRAAREMPMTKVWSNSGSDGWDEIADRFG